MKVLVTNLPGIEVSAKGLLKHYAKAGSRWPMTVGYARSVDYYPFPFWLAYTAALLKRDTEAEVVGLDGVAMDMTPKEFFDTVKKQRPDLLIAELVFLTLKDDLNLLKRIKEEINCKIVLCGNYPTVYPKEILEEYNFVDYLLMGEYEITAKELVLGLMQELPRKQVLGLAFREKKEVITNRRRPLISDLDILPYPERVDFPVGRYYDFAFYWPSVSMMTSRGCPSGCTFCTERHIMYNSARYRKRNPTRIVDEIEYSMKQFNAKQIYFDDMSFTVDKQHVSDICSEILKRNIEIPWTCMGDAMFIDYGTLEKMKKAGCIGMKFGVESADPEILKRIGKPLNLERVKQITKWCRELGISTHATYCLGLPGESKTTIMNTLRFMQKLDTDTSQVSKAVPYPGTPFYKWVKEYDYLLTNDLRHYDGTTNAILNYPQLSNEDLDRWFEKFSKMVSRKKIWKYLFSPRESFSLATGIYKQKGIQGLLRSIRTFVGRAI